MGPITLIDKSTIQGLKPDEVWFLDLYFSLVISPILMRELISMLAKAPKPKRDWEHMLSVIAKNVDTMHSYIPSSAEAIARASLLGEQLPMDGRIPLSHGKKVRSRDGSYGIIFSESPEKGILRDWQRKNFTEYYRGTAKAIRDLDHGVDLSKLREKIAKKFKNVPDFSTLKEMVEWCDKYYLSEESQANHFELAANNLLTGDDLEAALTRWRGERLKSFRDSSPYAYYYYRCNVLFQLGFGKGLISSSKKQKSHLDIQYIYYLPFCQVFITSDQGLMQIAQLFKRSDQILIEGDDLKNDLFALKEHRKKLGEEGAKQFTIDNRDYPPEILCPTIESVWKSCMAPRPPKRKAVAERNPEQDRKLVEHLNRFMKDSIDVATNQTLDPSVKEKWQSKGIEERCLEFVDSVLEFIEIKKKGSWEEVKKEFCYTHVAKIYNLHADIWRPDDNYSKLAEDFRKKARPRFLYLGDIEPDEVDRQLARWSMHFDQILVRDPFQPPWARKHDYNPIAHPKQYESETLKLVYFLVILYPLIASKKVILVPDPTEFESGAAHEFHKFAKPKFEDCELRVAMEKDIEEWKGSQLMMLLRTYARLPEEQRRSIVKRKFPEREVDEHLKFLATLRKEDPLCLDRDMDLKEGELISKHSGGSFEGSLLLCGLYGALPFSSMETRKFEYARNVTKPEPGMATVIERLKSIPGFSYVDTLFASVMCQNDALKEFRQLLDNVFFKELSTEGVTDEHISKFLDVVREDCQYLAEIYSKSSGVEAAKLLEEMHLEILQSDYGFASDKVRGLISKWFPEAIEGLPRYFFGIER